ncbi:MAG: cysteine--tRNA ligase [Dehalococcoidaceae bacterium]|nr:cysteine--tRNA ligase [Dehalococcoidaceae bacterium]
MNFFNTVSGKKELFTPNGKNVGLYICGPTVYSDTHLGHAKSYVSFDVMKRWLEYRRYEVTHIQNFTDVSDETALGASKEGIGELEFTQKYENEFLDKMKLLSNTPATKYTRASDFVKQIAEETKKLLDAEEAYQTEEGVFLRIKQEEHGKLLGVDLEKSLVEGTSEVDPGPKESPHDTLLWGPPLEGGKIWEFEGLPAGRPGWHLECTLMSSSELELPIDIHWGGIDLIYPHHETEIILAERIGLGNYCDFWMHNGLMEDAEGKLSKSRGERITLEEVFEDCPPAALRFYLLSHHYRDFTPYLPENLLAACQEGERLGANAVDCMIIDPTDPREDEEMASLVTRFEKAMDDDLDTPKALDVLRDLDVIAGKRLENNGDIGPVSGMYSIFQSVLGVFS